MVHAIHANMAHFQKSSMQSKLPCLVDSSKAALSRIRACRYGIAASRFCEQSLGRSQVCPNAWNPHIESDDTGRDKATHITASGKSSMVIIRALRRVDAVAVGVILRQAHGLVQSTCALTHESEESAN